MSTTDKSGLTKKELALEKLVEKIKFETTLEGIVDLDNFLLDFVEFVENNYRIFVHPLIIDEFIKYNLR
jgi:hypothetical protein